MTPNVSRLQRCNYTRHARFSTLDTNIAVHIILDFGSYSFGQARLFKEDRKFNIPLHLDIFSSKSKVEYLCVTFNPFIKLRDLPVLVDARICEFYARGSFLSRFCLFGLKFGATILAGLVWN